MITAMPRIAIAVRDYEAAVSMFRDTLGMPVLDFSDRTVPDLGAHVGMCVPTGGSNIELMAPANPDMALSQSLLKFLDHRGDGLYALMLEAPVPDEEAEVLSARGMNVLPLMRGASGRDIHPSSTHGVLIRVYPIDSAGIHGEYESQSPVVSGIERVIVATADAELAARTYADCLGLDVGPVERDEARGVMRAVCTPPKGGVIELVSAADVHQPFAAAIGDFVESSRGGMWGLVLKTDDAKATSAALGGRGASFQPGPAGLETTLFGTRIILS